MLSFVVPCTKNICTKNDQSYHFSLYCLLFCDAMEKSGKDLNNNEKKNSEWVMFLFPLKVPKLYKYSMPIQIFSEHD